MRCLIHYTTLIIGEKIPRGDVVWQFFITLVQIIDILTKTFCTDDDLNKLSTLITSHHSFYVSFFKDSLKPKHHHMLHYPNIIRQIGPLTNIWCMRLEGKHKELKNYAKCITSRVNLPKSIMIKQQLKFSKRVVCGTGLERKVEFGPFTKNFVNINPIYEKFNSVSWIKVHNQNFHPGELIQIKQEPIAFGEIVQCIRYKDEYLFEIALFTVLEFSSHFQAYKIIKTPNTYNIFVTEEIFTSFVTKKHNIQHDTYIRAKPISN